MKFTKAITAMVAISAISAMSTNVFAAATAEEAKQLGTTLTPWGAIKAGNKDGSIPEWKPLKTPPAGYKAGGPYISPYADEKPILVINAKNMDAYADKLAESTKLLMKRDPNFFINVYPGHRHEWATKAYEDGSIKNATRGKMTADGLGVEGAWGGVPFPIPKTGSEVIWNVQLRNMPPSADFPNAAYLADSSNRVSLLSTNTCHWVMPYNDQKLEGTKAQSAAIWRMHHCLAVAPARSAGEQNLAWYSMNPAEHPQRTWTYLVGQRRVRLAPEFSYDTPVAPFGGALNYDEIAGFTGKMDRFNFKLLGQKEMYVPANNYNLYMEQQKLASATPGIPNMENWRFELRRVWVVEATRNPDARHSSKTRRFYVDADNWVAKISEAIDDSGKFSRAMLGDAMFLYDVGYFNLGTYHILDLNKGQVLTTGIEPKGYAPFKITTQDDSKLVPEYMSSTGVR